MKHKPMEDYKFWKTQPVRSFDEETVEKEGPIDDLKTVDDVPKAPRKLLSEFEWCVIDVDDKAQLEELYDLLYKNYIEDDDNTFRFHYTPQFLEWGLKPPGYRKEWNIGVRTKSTNKLIASITGIPQFLRVRDLAPQEMAEINFLCVHKKLRSKRLAPVLIQEVTRQVNLNNIWQALYTAGIILPSPLSTTRYYHRPLNWSKLHSVGFSAPLPGQTPAQMVARYTLPKEPTLKNIRPMTEEDIPQVRVLLNDYLSRFDLAPHFATDEETSHWFLGPKNPLFKVDKEHKPVHAYVVTEDDSSDSKKNGGKITDFFSFYVIPTSVLGNSEYDSIKIAYSFYYATNVHQEVPKTKRSFENQKKLASRLKVLQQNALILSKNIGCDVHNAITCMDNPMFLNELKYSLGTGVLNYYLFNYRAYPVNGGINESQQLETPTQGGVGTIML